MSAATPPDAHALGLRLEVLALRVQRGERLPEREIAAVTDAVTHVAPTLDPGQAQWLHERVQRVVDAYAAARDELAATSARIGRGRRAVRAYAAVGGGR